MFKIVNLNSDEVFFLQSPRYVKLDSRGFWVKCKEDDAQCIALNGQRFSIAGKKIVDDAPQVLAVSPVDAGIAINNIIQNNLANAQNIDDVKAAVQDISKAVLDIYFNGI